MSDNPSFPLERQRGNAQPNGDNLTPIQRTARILLASLYHNPEHIGRVSAEEPVMPDDETDRLWELFVEVNTPDGFDTARLVNKLGKPPKDSKARQLLNRIQKHEIIGPVESAGYGHKGEQLEAWARDLAEHAAKQRLATELGSIAAELNDDDNETDLDEVQSRIITVTQNAVSGAMRGGLRHISEFGEGAIEDVGKWERGEDVDFLPTGFYGLDEIITGVPFQELTIFAAPSGAGKTTWLIQLLMQVARRDRGEAVCFFSIEMPARKILHRAAAAWGHYELNLARREPQAFAEQDLKYGDLHREYLGRLSRLPIYIDDDPEPTIGQITSRTMQVQAEHNVALVGVDYDEKVQADDAPPSEELRVANISRGLKTFAKRIDCACVALSQYNSAPASQVRPGTDSDLRYSRKKKHEAANTLHWYWPDYWIRSGDVDPAAGDDTPPDYDPQRPERGILYVGKNRDGAPGQLPLNFHPEQLRFEDPADPQREQTG